MDSSNKASDIVGTIDQETLDKNNGKCKISDIGRYVVTEDLTGPLIIDGKGDMKGLVIDFGKYSIGKKN